MDPALEIQVRECLETLLEEGVPHAGELSKDEGEESLLLEGSESRTRAVVVERDQLVDRSRWTGVGGIDAAACAHPSAQSRKMRAGRTHRRRE